MTREIQNSDLIQTSPRTHQDLQGMGFALIQIIKKNMRLIQCGSSNLTSTCQRYEVCELKCLAVQNVIFSYGGLPHFEVRTDHLLLVRTFSKGLYNIDNPRHMPFQEKVIHYNFTFKWVQEKTHYIVDML